MTGFGTRTRTQHNSIFRNRAFVYWSRMGHAMQGACIVMACAGCAQVPPPPAKPVEAKPTVVSLEEWMARARSSLHEGDREAARAAYRSAAQSYPAEALPWLKLSEDYFNVQDYGHAVLTAQEALQRDAFDNLAHSILAVSGLRIAAGSLPALRQDAVYRVGSRDEALAVTKALRDALGEPAVLPQPPVSRPIRPVVRAQRPAAPAAAAAVMPTSTATGPAAKTVPSSLPAGSPLDKLK